MKEINFMHYTYGIGLFKINSSIFDIKPTASDYFKLCRDIGIRTALCNPNNFTKRAKTVNIFFGIEGLNAFVFGYKIGLDIINPFSPYQWMFNDFYIYRLNGGDK